MFFNLLLNTLIGFNFILSGMLAQILGSKNERFSQFCSFHWQTIVKLSYISCGMVVCWCVNMMML